MTKSEMEKYRGKRSIPSNFDEFWDNQVKTISQLPNFNLKNKVTGISGVECSELTFEGTNHSKIYAKMLLPKTSKKVPIIFHFHGYQGRSYDWCDYLKYVISGYGVVAMDVRGQAGKSEDHGWFNGITVKGHVIRGMLDGPEHLFYKDVFLDVYSLIEIIANLKQTDENDFQTLGGSQGGALAIVGAALNPRIKQVTAMYPFLTDFPRVMELAQDVEPYNELYRYFKYHDPLYSTEEQVMSTLDFIDMKNFAHRIDKKFSLITGLKDEVCPPSTQYALFNRIASNDKKHYLVPQYGHEPMMVAVPDLIMNIVTKTSL